MNQPQVHTCPPTLYEAKPLIRVYGTGTVTVGSISVQITQSTDYTDIDCDIQNAYRGLTSRNAYMKLLTNNKFPTLPAGSTGITYTGFSRVDIMPRWWTI